jgi:hypothetical protein
VNTPVDTHLRHIFCTLDVQLGAVREAGRVLLIAAAPIAVSATSPHRLADYLTPVKMCLTSS